MNAEMLEEMNAEMLEELLGGGRGGRAPKSEPMNPEVALAQAAKLADLARAYEGRQSFKPGDIVEWKPGMMNRKVPAYGQPCVVVEVLPGNVDTAAESGSAYYREPLDLRLGMIYHHDGQFTIFPFDSARFRTFQAPALNEAAAESPQ